MTKKKTLHLEAVEIHRAVSSISYVDHADDTISYVDHRLMHIGCGFTHYLG